MKNDIKIGLLTERANDPKKEFKLAGLVYNQMENSYLQFSSFCKRWTDRVRVSL